MQLLLPILLLQVHHHFYIYQFVYLVCMVILNTSLPLTLHLQYLHGLQQDFVLNFDQEFFPVTLLLISGNTASKWYNKWKCIHCYRFGINLSPVAFVIISSNTFVIVNKMFHFTSKRTCNVKQNMMGFPERNSFLWEKTE